MGYDGLFNSDPLGGREKILNAVYEILREEGHSSVSIQRVADEAGLGKSTVYHHFDDKEDLMLAFNEAALSQIRERLTHFSITDPVERLRVVVTRFVLGRMTTHAAENAGIEDADFDEREPLRALIDIRAQAVHDPENRERISAIDESICSELAETIRDGIKDGVFRNVDAERTADRLYTLMLGGLLRRTTTNDTDLEAIRDDAYELIDELRTE